VVSKATFACGAAGLRCERGSEYCFSFEGGIVHSPQLSCVPLPAQCQVPGADCSCHPDAPSAFACQQDGDGDFTVTAMVP
jgi:hypothetical protein